MDTSSRSVPVQVLQGNEDWVECVCFYADENKLVSGSTDDILRIWDRKTGVAQVLSGHTETVREVDVSLDGKMVVSGSTDKTVRIWGGESGETMHTFEGHEDGVYSVQFSPDSSRVVSASYDHTVRVWSVETGKLAVEPIDCHGDVYCVRYSPSGDRIASGASSVQIWNAETGDGILSIRNSSVMSLAWTVDGTHIIGGGYSRVTIWNSDNGEQVRMWTAHGGWIKLSLSPNATHLATSNRQERTAVVFDISTGKEVASLTHHQYVLAIAFSRSGRLIATGCTDGKIYLSTAPASEDPKTASPTSSLSSFLDRPAILLAEPPRNDGVDLFWDSRPDLPRPAVSSDQRISSRPQRDFNKVRKTLANIFTGRPTGATQNSPVRETIKFVEVAAGKDRPYAATIDPPKFNRVQKILYTIIHCRKPDEEEEEVAAAPNTAVDSSQGPAGKTVIDTQPQRSEMMTGPSSASAIPKASKASARAQSTPLRDPPPPPVPQAPSFVPPSPTSAVTSVPPFTLANISRPISTSGKNFSPEEVALIQEYRRLKDTSEPVVVELVAKPASSNAPRPTSLQPLLQHEHNSPSAVALSPIEIAMT